VYFPDPVVFPAASIIATRFPITEYWLFPFLLSFAMKVCCLTYIPSAARKPYP